ncbi:MAG: hypothetical protein PHD19_14340 [Dechloromonas sp.]|nr:hypothetical protein [Dechloromonas sp.]
MAIGDDVASNELLIYGAGGHAKFLISAIEAGGRQQIIGLLEDQPSAMPRNIMGYPVIGGPDLIDALLAAKQTRIALAIGDNPGRQRIAEQLSAAGFELVTVIHPAACIARGCEIGAGSFIHAQAVIGPDCTIGRGAIISAQCTVGHDSLLGDWVHLTRAAGWAAGPRSKAGPSSGWAAWSCRGSGSAGMRRSAPTRRYTATSRLTPWPLAIRPA